MKLSTLFLILTVLYLPPHGELKKKPDSGYYVTTNNILQFTYYQEYSTPSGALLNFKIYNNRHEDVTPARFSPQVHVGPNRYSLAFTACDNMPTGIYLLEVANNKGEKLYLRFSVSFSEACEGPGGGMTEE